MSLRMRTALKTAALILTIGTLFQLNSCGLISAFLPGGGIE